MEKLSNQIMYRENIYSKHHKPHLRILDLQIKNLYNSSIKCMYQYSIFYLFTFPILLHPDERKLDQNNVQIHWRL